MAKGQLSMNLATLRNGSSFAQMVEDCLRHGVTAILIDQLSNSRFSRASFHLPSPSSGGVELGVRVAEATRRPCLPVKF